MIVTEVSDMKQGNYGDYGNRYGGDYPYYGVGYGQGSGYAGNNGANGYENGGYGSNRNGGYADENRPRGGQNAYGGYGMGDIPPEYAEQLGRYGNMNSDELTREMMAQAAVLRAQGQLDIAKLEDFCNKAAPFLTAEQLARMRALIGMLKNG